MSAHIVVVEDEPVTRSLLAAHLERGGYRVSATGDAAGLGPLLAASDVDLVLLDIELPGKNGFEAGAALRASAPDVGLIYVTRRADVVDRVVGLELGADDYVTKPPEMRELLARVRAVLRRRGREAPGTTDPPPPIDRLHPYRLDATRACLVGRAAEEIPVTRGELVVLTALLAADGRVVERDTLAEALRREVGASNPRSVDVLVHRVRRKLGEGGAVEPRIVLTVHGVGYRLGGVG